MSHTCETWPTCVPVRRRDAPVRRYTARACRSSWSRECAVPLLIPSTGFRSDSAIVWPLSARTSSPWPRLTSVRTFWIAFNLLTFVALGAFAWVTRSGALRSVARDEPDQFDLLLLGVVIAGGIGLACVGYLYSRADRSSSLAFLSDGFTNLGAGLVGAAVTFGLFQSLLSKRTVTTAALEAHTKRVEDAFDEVGHELGQLRIRIDAIGASTALRSHATPSAIPNPDRAVPVCDESAFHAERDFLECGWLACPESGCRVAESAVSRCASVAACARGGVRAALSVALAPALRAMSSCAPAALSGGCGERSSARERGCERGRPGPGVVEA